MHFFVHVNQIYGKCMEANHLAVTILKLHASKQMWFLFIRHRKPGRTPMETYAQKRDYCFNISWLQFNVVCSFYHNNWVISDLRGMNNAATPWLFGVNLLRCVRNLSSGIGRVCMPYTSWPHAATSNKANE